MTSVKNQPVYEHVVIVGAGIAGSSLACALEHNTKLEVGLVEANTLREGMPPCDDHIDGFDARVSALTVASQQWLASIEIWPTLAKYRLSLLVIILFLIKYILRYFWIVLTALFKFWK